MEGCCSGMCGACHGVMKMAWGALLLVNAFIWPKWMGIDGWLSWIAVLLVLSGVLKLLKPSCGHCGSMMKKK